MAKRDFWRTTVAATALMTAVVLAPGAAQADVDEGIAAYEAGDYEAAMAEWRPLAEAGDAAAQYWLGRLFERGEGVPASLARAAMWYRLAAGQDNPEAQAALDGVLETLRARETGQGAGPRQTADGGAGASSAPGYEPERDSAYATPGETPSRTADVDQPAGAPTRDGVPVADASGSPLDPAVPAARQGEADAVEVDGGPVAQSDDERDSAAGVADAADAVAGDAAAEAEAVDPADPAAIAADALEAELLEEERLAEAGVDDALSDAPADEEADGGAGLVDDANDGGIGDVAAIDEDMVELADPLADEAYTDEVLAEDGLSEGTTGDDALVEDAGGLGFEAPLPPELTDALADGALDAEEIADLVEDGVLTEEVVDDLIEAGVLDEAALAELAEAGVLDDAALDALVDAGLVDEALVDSARDMLADEAVGEVIGDGVVRLSDDRAVAETPERRLITARP